jgi:hypothetical protein
VWRSISCPRRPGLGVSSETGVFRLIKKEIQFAC